MTVLKQIYKCNVCGNIVEVLHTGKGTLVCCQKPMERLVEKNQDIGQEKHLPIIEKTKTGIKIKVGAVPHPMEKEHYIEWIEIITDKKSCRKFLTPDDKPEAEFSIKSDSVRARIYCNIHGLWKR